MRLPDLNGSTKFRKKPVVVEAMQYLGQAPWIIRWIARVTAIGSPRLAYEQEGELFIHTLEGKMHISVGDWVIKGDAGEFYPCKPDIFEATYEEAE